MGAQPLGFAPWQPFGVYTWQAYVQPGGGHQSTPGMHRVAVPTATLGRVEPSATHSAVPQAIGGVYSLGGSIESHLIPLPSLHDGEGSSFPGSVPSDDVVNPNSVMAIKPGDSGVVIIRLMSLLTPGQLSGLWPAPTFILGSLVKCHH